MNYVELPAKGKFPEGRNPMYYRSFRHFFFVVTNEMIRGDKALKSHTDQLDWGG
jgi:hypothetical protein